MFQKIRYTLVIDDSLEAGVWNTKGFFPGSILSVEEKKYELVFYDVVRIRQEIESEVSENGFFIEKNLIVVSDINRSEMEKAVEFIVNSGQYLTFVES